MTHLIWGTFTQCSLLQRNHWWDSTPVTLLAWSLTSWLLNSYIPQQYFKKETFLQGPASESKCKTAQPENVQRQPEGTVPEESQTALTLWTWALHPGSAHQLPGETDRLVLRVAEPLDYHACPGR